jgi:hypothetical protein
MVIVAQSGPISSANVTFPGSPIRGSILPFTGPVPFNLTYLSPGQGVDDVPANLTFSSAGADPPSPNTGLRATFPSGLDSDPAICLELLLSGAQQGVSRFYFGYDGRLPTTFALSSFGANAMKFGNPKDNGGADNIVMAFLGLPTAAGYYPGAGIQGPVTVNIPNNNLNQFGTQFFQPGVRNRFEHVWISDNPFGAGNGTYRIYQNGVLASQATLKLEAVGSSPGFRALVLYIARAIIGGNPTVSWYWDFDNLVVATG